MSDHQDMLDGYFRLMNMNGAAHVYREAVASGLLDAMAEGPVSTEELARRCGLAPRPIGLMLQVLRALALVQADDGAWQLTPLARALIAGGYRDLGDGYWQHLPTFMKTDAPLVQMDDPSQSESHYQAQAAALAWMLSAAAEEAAGLITTDLKLNGPLQVLDVGAGSAVWSLAIARACMGSSVTAVDWPAVLKVAQSTAQQMGLAPHLHCLPGDYHKIELPPEAFDVAILGNVAHLETHEGNRDLATRLFAALRPGGHILVFDVFPTQAGGELNGALYALGLALRTAHGRVYPVRDLGQIMLAAGFTRPRHMPLQSPPRAVGVVIGKKPDDE